MANDHGAVTAPGNMEAWIAALRSGEFQQAPGHLRRNGAYCCLGVACELHSQTTGTSWDGDAYLYCSDIPSPGVLAWLGITSDTACDLASMNDNEACSFSQIADYLETLRGQ